MRRELRGRSWCPQLGVWLGAPGGRKPICSVSPGAVSGRTAVVLDEGQSCCPGTRLSLSVFPPPHHQHLSLWPLPEKPI